MPTLSGAQRRKRGKEEREEERKEREGGSSIQSKVQGER
jgi:hypothetical protein